MRDFLARRAIAGIEAVEGNRYMRTLRVRAPGRELTGDMCVAPRSAVPRLRVSVSPSLAAAFPLVLSRMKHLLDLACQPDEIAAALGPLAESIRGCACPARWTASRSRCARSWASRSP